MRKLVTIEQVLEKKPIEGADKIEAIRIRDWWVVSQKDTFQLGDRCLFHEVDSFLPIRPEYEFLLKGSSKKRMIIDGKQVEGIRLKTIKLRGQISQGLALPIHSEYMQPIGYDMTELLGVKLYEPPMPAELAGKVKGFFPGFIPKTDEERIQNMSDILSNYYVTEKLDGTSVTYYKKDGVFGVCSRNLELLEGETTQWKIAKKLDLATKLPDNFAIQGELIGEGIQKNPLKRTGQELFCFNAYNIANGIYLNFKDFIGFCDSLGIRTVPLINDNYSLPSTVDELLKFADGNSMLNPESPREGIVIRPKVEMRYNNKRLSFKVISNSYLLKNDA